MADWAEIYPPFGVSIACGELELRAMGPDDVPGLLDVAVDGIVPEGSGYPFLTDWALLPPERLRTSSARVSDETGYERFDVVPVDRLGEPVDEVRFRLRPEQLNRPAEPITYQGVEAFRRFIGLDD